MIKKLVLAALSVSVIAVTGCSQESGGQQAAGGQGAPSGVPVNVVTVEQQNVSTTLELPGRVSAFRQSHVRPQVTGVITQRLFEQGTVVEKGQQLYQIDDLQYKAALNSAKADVASANANVKTLKAKAARYKDLMKVNAISGQEYDDVVAQLDQAMAAVSVAEAQVALAEVNMDYTKVYAPISGRISRSFYTEGALVTANQTDPLATITQLDPVYVDVQVSSEQALGLQMALRDKGSLTVDLTIPGSHQSLEGLKGTVEFSEVIVNESTGSVTIRARFPNPDNILLPGLYVRAIIHLSDTAALVVPQRATIRQPDGSLSVWVVNGDNPELRSIGVLQAFDGNWQVSNGLSAGEQIIVAGYHKLRPGAKVMPIPLSNDA